VEIKGKTISQDLHKTQEKQDKKLQKKLGSAPILKLVLMDEGGDVNQKLEASRKRKGGICGSGDSAGHKWGKGFV